MSESPWGKYSATAPPPCHDAGSTAAFRMRTTASACRSSVANPSSRYIFTAIARGIARGADKKWLHDLFGFAVAPDQVFYLQVGVNDLVPRVLESGKMNYWEAGMDMNYGDDLYDSFIAYQTELIHQFNVMAEEHNFVTLDARQDPKEIQRQLRRAVGEYLESSGYHANAHLSHR